MKKIGIIDADLIARKNHRFPNLACEKISAYWKEKGYTVELLFDYKDFNKYKRIYISKVFTDTPCPKWITDPNWLKRHKKVHIGGTGFYFDKAPNLPVEIEHHMPDYHLYDGWIKSQINKAKQNAIKCGEEFDKKRYMTQFKEYLDYSIGFLTRGCFRKCEFCVNKKYNHVFAHSPLNEFLDNTRKKICLLDDNFLGYPQWKKSLAELIKTGKPFKFKQGLDERLLTDEKCEMLFSSKYDGDFTFAFDKISDYKLIREKLKLLKKYKKNKGVKFYVLVGFESTDHIDIEGAFKRIRLLLKYGCLPYIMRFQNKNDTPWKQSKYRTLYTAIARWCNQQNIIKKMSFRQFCVANQKLRKQKKDGKALFCSTYKAMKDFEKEHPKIAKKYFDMRFDEIRIDRKKEN